MSAQQDRNYFISRFLPYALFLPLMVFFFIRYADYIFFYQEKTSLFLVTFDYLKGYLEQPGGFLEYLWQLQAALYYYPAAGAVLVALEIAMVVFLVAKVGQVIGRKRQYFFPFLLGAMLFYLQTNYRFRAFNIMGILFALALFNGFVSYTREKLRWVAAAVFPLIYFLLGSFSYLFVGLLSLHWMLEKKWAKLAGIWLIGMIFFFVGSEFLFYQTNETLLLHPFTVSDLGDQAGMFFITVFIVLFLPFLVKIQLQKLTRISVGNFRLIEAMPLVIVFGVALAVISRIDEKSLRYFRVEKLFYERRYDELNQYNEKYPSNNQLTSYLNNVALAETGRLTDSLFRYRQSPDGSTLFLKWELISEVLKRGGYYYYAIGMINEAQRWAYEFMVMEGNTPEALKMLIKTELIKGNYKTAEKYIAVLQKSLFYGNEAQRYRKFLFNDDAVNADPELGNKKRLDTKRDFFVQSDNPSLNLVPVLAADSANQVAIEYQLAWLLLQKDMEGVVKMLPVMEKAGFKTIPKNVEEAVVTYKLLKVGELPNLTSLRINPQTEQRFQNYYRIFQQNSGDRSLAKRALAQFSDTYWYYVFFY